MESDRQSRIHLAACLEPLIQRRMFAVHRASAHLAIPDVDCVLLSFGVELQAAEVAIGDDQVGAAERGEHDSELACGKFRLRGLRGTGEGERRFIEPGAATVNRSWHYEQDYHRREYEEASCMFHCHECISQRSTASERSVP